MSKNWRDSHRLPGSTNLTDFDANSIFMQQTINHDNFPECYMAFVAQLGPFLSHAVSVRKWRTEYVQVQLFSSPKSIHTRCHFSGFSCRE
ncbi:hypothetical protein X801_07782 [Opisthorchis viverrini]|uniref:Uncharacterized protein n=1 Tax=Opisthorchis viverrini TaxID=6198 RepID=A0A1S8WPN6_OPIVI|nr:hypothetical protein X801_07782 [Opisthorchis viverrini]